MIWKVTEKGWKWFDEVTMPVYRGTMLYVFGDEDTVGIVNVLDTVDTFVLEGDTVEEAYKNVVRIVESDKDLREYYIIPDLKYWKEAYKRGFIEKVEGKVL